MIRTKIISPVFLLFFGFSAILSSCTKKSEGPEAYTVMPDPRDSAYLYTKDIYLWTTDLPDISVFKPRNADDIYQVMDRVRTYHKEDKWSFAETKAETEQSQKGQDNDFGFLVKFGSGSDTEIVVTYVYANSSAGQKGVKRTWRLNKINGRTISRRVQADVDYINEIFFGTPQSAEFEFKKPDGSVVTVPLSKITYDLNTVLYSNVYEVNNKKIGYFVFNEFSGDVSVNELVSTINSFQNQNVDDVIVDLRYNRGGLVSTQDTLANMLAPKAVGRGQKMMYSYVFNNRYRSWNESFKFYKTGTLNLSRIVFIVSPSSASASELLINNLRPVMNVVLIGDTRTYGKPVGFFPIGVYEYNIFPVSFKTVNSDGVADYFAGFPVDKNVADDLNHDFGDVEEASLKEALYYLTNNETFTASASAKAGASTLADIQQVRELNFNLSEHLPSVTLEDRPSRIPPAIRRLQN